MTAGLIQSTPDQIDFKASHFVVEIYAASDVTDGRVARAIVMTGQRLTADR